MRSRGGAVLLAALVVDAVGNGLFQPLSVLFFAKLTTVPLALIGVLLSAANTLTLPVPLLAGKLADRVGPWAPVVGAQVAQGIGFLLFTRVTGPVGIFFSAALVAIGVRFFWSSIFTAVADYVDGSAKPRSRDSWFAWANATRTAGLAIGGLITGVVVTIGTAEAYRALAYGSAACFLCAGAAIAVFVRAPRRAVGDAGGYRGMLRARPFLAFTGLNAVFALTSMMLALGLPVFVTVGLHGPPWLAPAMLVGNTVLLTVFTAPAVRLVAPLRRTRVLMGAAVLWAGWCLAFAVLVPGQAGWVVPVLLAATFLFTAAETVHGPVSQSLATELSLPAERGRYLAVFQYSFTIASLVAPAFFTTLFEVGYWLPWLVLGVVNVLAAVALRLLERVIPAAVAATT
ncbi:MFS transporter [Amycolatopsis rhabdoformis]|uniref:MFS transporter n=1 Tax=Amycolatopsis rhabdoformis TaxID=1448059 RepID=A0ABZ1HYF3_9PSEU|nr:MFS transporter [Amycolatopsis rhabdoformis]WSE26393.1 MFS transporter [Amycolatopsis rhabdoformis]